MDFARKVWTEAGRSFRVIAVRSREAELKGDWGIGKVPSQSFNANHAAMLIRMLAFNLFRRFVTRQHRAPHM